MISVPRKIWPVAVSTNARAAPLRRFLANFEPLTFSLLLSRVHLCTYIHSVSPPLPLGPPWAVAQCVFRHRGSSRWNIQTLLVHANGSKIINKVGLSASCLQLKVFLIFSPPWSISSWLVFFSFFREGKRCVLHNQCHLQLPDFTFALEQSVLFC